MDETELADKVLTRLVRASTTDSSMRFMVTRSIERSGGYRISFPGGRFNARPELVQNLLQRKLVQVVDERAGTLIIGVTVRGFDYHARNLATE